MSTNFPTSLDSFTNPISTDSMQTVSHATQHTNENDALAAIEAKVGANSSAVTTSHDYKLGEVTGSDKAVGKTATQVLANKTFTSPLINVGSDATGDIYYRNGSGVLTRLPIGTAGQILDVSAGGIPEWIANPAAANASTTVKGVSQAATSAQITAGTATGSTGAILVVTPDALAASAPTFSAANLTNIKDTTVKSYAGTYFTSTAGTISTQNVDTIYTTTFTPKIITINYFIRGTTGSGSSASMSGVAVWDGTTIKTNWNSSPAGNPTAGSTSAPTIGDGGTNDQTALSIINVTSTGFTVRVAFVRGSTFNGQCAANYTVTATQ